MNSRIYQRIDLLVEASIRSFSDWLPKTDWFGKEHDCVNIFVMRHLLPLVSRQSAIKEPSQIRIEGAVKQPSGYEKVASRKDVVIWKDPMAVSWDSKFNPVRVPRVVIEWKVIRKGNGKKPLWFDAHDQRWLEGFTTENPSSLGYLVSVDLRQSNRGVMAGKVKNGSTRQVRFRD